MENAERVAAIFEELFDYSLKTGLAAWRLRPLHHFPDKRAMKIWNTRYAGQRVKKEGATGYLVVNVKVGSKRVSAYFHRVVWVAHKGPIKDGLQVDHINGNRKDNRLSNLRLCRPRQNSFNMKKREGLSSRYKGVSWNKRENKWRAHIKIEGRQAFLGSFDSEEGARDAYREKAKKIHGEFYTERGHR